MHIPRDDVVRLLDVAGEAVEKAEGAFDSTMRARHALHKAEQVELLVRLAADSGARRGELAALCFGDLDGRVLTIERGTSGEEVGPTKTRQVRRLTLGRTTVDLWRIREESWRRRADDQGNFGAWLFSRDVDHGRRLTTSGLGHWFTELRDDAGLTGVSLHRLRHTVATYLVGRGDLLQAQHRLGHRDAATTLRNYAHAMPLQDEAVADDIDEMVRSCANGTVSWRSLGEPCCRLKKLRADPLPVRLASHLALPALWQPPTGSSAPQLATPCC